MKNVGIKRGERILITEICISRKIFENFHGKKKLIEKRKKRNEI